MACTCTHVHVCMCACMSTGCCYTQKKALSYILPEDPLCPGESRGSLVMSVVLVLNSTEHLSWHMVSFTPRAVLESKSNRQDSAHLHA